MLAFSNREIKQVTLIILISQILTLNFVELCQVLKNSREEVDNVANETHYIQESSFTINHDGFSVANRKQPIIQGFDSRKEIYSKRHFNYSYTFFYEGHKTQGRETVANLGVMGMTARLQSSVYTDLLIHYYDNLNELEQSGGPEVNQELCLMQLKYLIDKAKCSIGESVYHSKEVNIFKLIDSFGRRTAGLLMGGSVWLGDYDQCLKLNLPGPRKELIKARYCMSNFRHYDWDNHSEKNRLIAIKVAACLPKSCDSKIYKNKYELVESLIKIAIGSQQLEGFYVSSLYCLPDEQSSLRIWYQQSGVVITLALLASWIVTLVYSTHKYDRILFNRSAKLNTGIADERNKTDGIEQDGIEKIYKTLSIRVNFEKLFNTTNKSSLLDVQEDPDKPNELDQPDQLQDNLDKQLEQSPQDDSIVDLSNLEGIKVICMCYVILGHVLMSTTMVMSNGRDMASTTSVSWFIANLTPAFAVNSFFSITGILTSYLIYKTKQIHSIMKQPVSWLGLIIYRYLRILPLYLIVVLYLKHLAKFTGSGPLWDYGTSSIAQRKTCEDESIFWAILFGANFKSPFAHCIPSAWYLANDFHFFLVTPIFLSALHRNEKFGIKLLISSIILGTLASMASIFMTDFNNLLPIANFMPHGLKTYITFFEHNYAQPQYRIPAYLIGLLAGYIMFKYEDAILKFRSTKRAKYQPVVTSTAAITSDESPDWPDMFKRFGLLLSLLCLAICCITPLIATRLPFNEFFARLLVAFIMPSYHILFSVAIAIYILLASTGHGNKLVTGLLSSSYWKPLARVSLSALLVNIEIINYFIQTRKETLNINDQSLFVLNVSSIVVTYIVAVIVCVLFEAPLRGISNLGLSHVMKIMKNKSKRAKSG